MKAYLAGPLFSPEDHKELDIVEYICDSNLMEFFSPRVECKDIKFPPKDHPQFLELRDKFATDILAKNIEGINSCDILIANTRDFDPGTIWEMGYAFGINKPIITYTFKRYGLNIMLSQTSLAHVDNIDLREFSTLECLVKRLNSTDILKDYSKENFKHIRSQLFKITDIELY